VQQKFGHSMTSSVRASEVHGIRSLNFIDCSTGKSAAFRPRRNDSVCLGRAVPRPTSQLPSTRFSVFVSVQS
jgi:hypothetical protein